MGSSIPLEEVGAMLGISDEDVHVLALTKLLGPVIEGEASLDAVRQFQRHGAQWVLHEQFVYDPQIYDNLPEIPGLPGGIQPPGTITQALIVPRGMTPDEAEADTGWIAQFYLRPNYHGEAFPNPYEFRLVGPPTVILKEPLAVPDYQFPVTFYPSPDERLGLITIWGNPAPLDAAFETAYDIAAAVLDRLTLTADRPLPIVQSILFGVPSGARRIWLGRPPSLETLTAERLSDVHVPEELRNAVSLYREGVSSNSIFHSFLSLYRAYENAVEVRARLRRRTAQRVNVVTPEVIPEVWAFSEYIGLSFDEVKQKLWKPYRIALAHGAPSGGIEPRTAATAKDYREVHSNLAVVRHIAWITLNNVCHALTGQGD